MKPQLNHTSLPTLVFVYAVDSGLINTALDYAHKLVSPKTYPCNLCAVTYGALGERPEWRDFLRGLDVATEFIHRDERAERYPGLDDPLPAVYVRDESGVRLWIGRDELDACASAADLAALVSGRLAALKRAG